MHTLSMNQNCHALSSHVYVITPILSLKLTFFLYSLVIGVPDPYVLDRFCSIRINAYPTCKMLHSPESTVIST